MQSLFKNLLHHAQKMKFSIKDFFSKCDLIRRKLRIWSRLLKKSLMENFFFFWAVHLVNAEDKSCHDHITVSNKLNHKLAKYIEISTFWQRKMRSSTAELWQKIKKCNLLALIVGVGHFPVIFSIRIFFKWSLQFTGQHVTIFILLHFAYEMTTSLCL